MMDGCGILENGKVREVSWEEWAEWIASDRDFSKRRVAFTKTEYGEISTVFLGLDHSFVPGESLWFETLVFGGSMDQQMERYATLDEALIGHERMVASVYESAGKP